MARWYGSVQNRILEHIATDKVVVGMGATEILWSDRHAFEIVAVKDERHCTARRMKCTIIGDWYSQDYKIESDEDGYTVELFKTKEGRWVERHGRAYGNRFAIGWADEYIDPSF